VKEDPKASDEFVPFQGHINVSSQASLSLLMNYSSKVQEV
jgi:hypothetical protein